MANERIAAQSGSQTCSELLHEYLGLRARYTQQFFDEIKKSPVLMREHSEPLQRMRDLVKFIIAHLVARERELLDREVVDLAIQMGATIYGRLSRPLCGFLANQLWKLEGAPMEEAEGLTYIQQICEQTAPGEEYLATMELACACGHPDCPDSVPELVVANRTSRERQREGRPNVDIVVIGGPLPCHGSLSDILGHLFG